MRALVVDDEIVALKALTRRIQWEKYGWIRCLPHGRCSRRSKY